MRIEIESIESNGQEARPTFDEVFITIAKLWSFRSTCLRTKVGACLVKENIILSTGYNGNPKGINHCSTDSNSEYHCYKIKNNIPHGTGDELCTAVHAEANCILQTRPDERKDAILYCTHSPCSACAKLIVQSQIAEVHFLEGYPDLITEKLFADAGIKMTKSLCAPKISGNSTKTLKTQEWFKLSPSRVKGIFIFYSLLLVLGLVISIFSLIPDYRSYLHLSILTLALSGSLGISLIGSSIYYIRKLYKSCIQRIINSPSDNPQDRLQEFGVTMYFIMRPIYSLGFSILLVVLIKSFILTMSIDSKDLSEGIIYTCMFLSFFSGFSAGELISILEHLGKTTLSKFFNRVTEV